MAEPRKQLTLLSRMGFSDGDLTTPMHDEIMMWLDSRLRSGALTAQLLSAVGAGRMWDADEWRTMVDKTIERYVKVAQQLMGFLNRAIEAVPPTLDDENTIRTHLELAKKDTASPWDRVRELERNLKSRKCDSINRANRNQLVDVCQSIRQQPPSLPTPAIDITWEKPVASGKFIVGYVDLFMRLKIARRPDIFMSSRRCRENHAGRCSDDTELSVGPDSVPLQLDASEGGLDSMGWDSICVGRGSYGSYPVRLTTAKWDCVYETFDIAFEVKSKIPSLGEIVRQIRTYEEHGKAQWFVVCPDDRCAAPLEQQGIHFLKYEA